MLGLINQNGVKYILIITIVLVIIVGFSFSNKKRSISCINIENYKLLKESPLADQLSEYQIVREENLIKFSTENGYTLFFIKSEVKDNNLKVTLVGLDGYGLRDKEFNRYVCKLIGNIKKEASKK